MATRYYPLVLIGMSLVAHWPATWGGFIWDDDDYVQNNPTLRTADGLRQIWLEPGATKQYYPLVFTTFWIEYQLWGDSPGVYHFVNLLLHATNAVLFWLVLERLGVPGAWLAAGLFAVHPVQVESVAWITERKNVLSGVFYWSAFLTFLGPALPASEPHERSDRQSSPVASAPWSWRQYLLVLTLYAGALLSKTVTCSLPAVLLLVLWWRTGRVARHDALALIPMFILGAALALVTIWMEQHTVQAHGPDWDLTLPERCLIAGRALWFYAAKLIWPANLAFIYPRWQIDTSAAWQYLFPAAAVAVLIGLWLARRRLGAGPLVTVLCFVGTLLPALGFINVYPMLYSFVADHFQYLASAALFALAGAALVRWWPKTTPQVQNAGLALAGVVLLILGVLTWRQASIYRDLETLWTDTLAKNPQCWMAHYNLGLIYLRKGTQPEQRDAQLIAAGLRAFDQALELRPTFANGHNQRGVALAELNRLPEAIAEFQRALQLDPDESFFHMNLGSALCRQGRVDEGLDEYWTAVRLRPDFSAAHLNLGILLAQRGAHGQAIEHLQIVVSADVNNDRAWHYLGKALVAEKRVEDAVQALSNAVQLRPEVADYRFALADVLRRAGRYEEAARESTEGLRLRQGGPP